MKKKIALLLAFTMLLSIIPMNVLADAPGGQLSGLATGALWERTLGRATNLRHWAPGVLVAQPSNISIFKTNGLTPNHQNSLSNAGSWNTNSDSGLLVGTDAGSNLRSILASYDYFRERNDYAASVQMRIHNTRGFMASLFDAQANGFASWGYNFPRTLDPGTPGAYIPAQSQASVEAFLQFMTIASWDSITNIAAPRPEGRDLSTTEAAVEGDVKVDDGWIYGSTDRPSHVSDWLNDSASSYTAYARRAEEANRALEAIDVLVNSVVTAGGSIDATQANAIAQQLKVIALWRSNAVLTTTDIDEIIEALTGAGLTKTVSAANMSAILTAQVKTGLNAGKRVWEYIESGAGAFAVEAAIRDAGERAKVADAFAKAISDFRRQINNVIRQDVPTTSDGITTNRPRVPLMMIYPDRDTNYTPGTVLQDEFIVAIFPRYNGAGVDTGANVTAAMPLNSSSIIPTEVDVVLFRTDNRSNSVAYAAVPQLRVPIEYITHGDTNSESVYLTFNTRAGWPAAGESGGRTYLTSNSDSRFTVGLYDGADIDAATPRTFHRYGRAEVPGIRIAEAVQSAFDQKDWWIELKIDTPGFYWTQDSVGTTANSFQTNFQTRFQTNSSTAQTAGNDIRPVRQLQSIISRTPISGNNQYTTIAFPVELQGVTANLNRQINDWLQFNNLSIGATDRARIGDVVVDVNVYRAGNVGNNDEGGQWVYVPYPEVSFNTTVGNVPVASGEFSRITIGAGGPSINQYPSDRPTVNTQNSIRYLNANGINTGTSQNIPPIDTSFTAAQLVTGNGTPYSVGEFRWQWPPQSENGFGKVGDAVFEGEVVVARYANIGLELFLHESDNLEDFDLRSGIREWPYITTPLPGEIRPIGAIDVEQINDAENDLVNHLTARTVLRELAPGSLPATGAHPTVYSFNEGIQILGARIWSNEAYFISDHEDDDAEVWFGNQTREADNFLNASLDRNQLTIRPEIGREDRRYELAEITVEFYLSVQAGYESLYGTDIELTVSSGTVEEPFEGKLVVAHAWDPISVQTQNIVLDENDIEAVIGMVRGIDISDITITETRSGQLIVGDRIWIGLEGGISRGWGSADHVQLNAQTVETTGNLQVSPIQRDSHGFFVEVTRTASSTDEDGQTIKFGGVQVSGRVVPNQQYNLIVADSGVAKNWEGFSWINTQQQDVGFARGIVRGFFNEEPYITPAFTFEGADAIFTPPTTVNPPGGGGTTGVTPPIGTLPAFSARTIRESDPTYTTSYGQTLTAPLVQFVSTANNFVTAYVMFSVVADILGVEPNWDPATGVATFDNGLGTSVSLTNGSREATLTTPTGGTRTVPITASGISVDARLINDRFYVPVKFFDEVVPEFGIRVEWLENQPTGSRGVLVAPR